MNVKNSISESMNAIRGKESKDQSAKSIFSYKPIMSNILKYTVEEYKNCSLEEIMECIEGDTIQTGTALIEEDMAKTIRGERNELHTTDEAAATFDILSGNQEKVLSYIPDPDNEVCQKEVADMLSMVAYAKEQGEKNGKKIGKEQGEKIGENRLGMLMNILLKNKKYSDAERASEDKEYREKLYKEYGL